MLKDLKDQCIDCDIRQYEKIRKIATEQGEDIPQDV